MLVSPKVFISFSSRDREFVRKLFYSLKSQNIDIWDYSQRGEEIPWGESIPSVLQNQIEGSDYFVTIVSVNSADELIGRFTQLEVQTAIQKGMLDRRKILPIVLADKKPKEWSGIFKELETLMHLEISTADQKVYEEAIARVCRFLGVRYVPPFLGDLRLPFSERFQIELRSLAALPIAQYEELMLIINDFVHKFSRGDYLEADGLISYFLMMCRYRIPQMPVYYPQIVKGVCDLQLGRFIEAEEAFWNASGHAKRDENCFGGLGHVYFLQHRYEEALWAYKEALRVCPKEHNREIRFNILGTIIEMGGSVDDTGVLDEFDISELTQEDWVRVMNMKGIVHFKNGEFDEAIRIFEGMRLQQAFDVTAATYYYLALKETGRYEDAASLLRLEAEELGDTNLYHHLADLYLKHGDVDRALDVYKNHLCGNAKRARQYYVEYARILNSFGRKKMMRDACETVLNVEYFGIPRTEGDYFYDGFANFLLGRDERARYDFERSSGFCKKYYDQFEL
jgi:tetratricopeptide (TPR) repeat protein